MSSRTANDLDAGSAFAFRSTIVLIGSMPTRSAQLAEGGQLVVEPAAPVEVAVDLLQPDDVCTGCPDRLGDALEVDDIVGATAVLHVERRHDEISTGQIVQCDCQLVVGQRLRSGHGPRLRDCL